MGKNKTRYTLLGVVMILIFLQIIIPGNKMTSTYQYSTSIFLIPLMLFLLGGVFSYEDYRLLSLKRFAWLTVCGLTVYVISSMLYQGVYYFLDQDLPGAIESVFSNIDLVILSAPFRLNYLVMIGINYMILLIINKLVKNSQENKRKYLIALIIFGIISLIIMNIRSTYEIEAGLIYFNFVEKNILVYNMIFFGLGYYLRDQQLKKLTVDKKIRQILWLLFLYTIVYSFKIIGLSSWFNALTEGEKGNLYTMILRFSEMLLSYLFNIYFVIVINRLVIKNKLHISVISHSGQNLINFIIAYGSIISISVLLFEQSTMFYVSSIILLMVLIVINGLWIGKRMQFPLTLKSHEKIKEPKR